MADELEAPSRSLTLGEAMSEYLQTLKPGQRAAQATYIRKYVEFAGEFHLVSDLSGSKVEHFAENQIKASDPAAADRAAALKAFFQYLKKKGYTPTNLGVHIRVRKASTRGGNHQRVRIEQAPIEMTADGIAALKQQLEELTAKRPEMVLALETARSDGDLRENAPYHTAKEALAFHDQKIRELENALSRAVAVEGSDERSTVGSTVKVTNLDTETVHEYKLVGAQEANAAQQRISVESPVGKQLLGRRPGEEIVVTTPRGEARFRVEAVRQT